MEWQTVIEGATGGLTVAAVLGLAVRKLWEKLETKEKEIADLQACKHKLQEERIRDLKALLRDEPEN